MFAHTWSREMKAQSLAMTVICLGEINNNKITDINEHLYVLGAARGPALHYFAHRSCYRGGHRALELCESGGQAYLWWCRGGRGRTLRMVRRKYRVMGSHGGCWSHRECQCLGGTTYRRMGTLGICEGVIRLSGKLLLLPGKRS